MKTLYAKRPLLNAAEVIQWAKDQGFRTTLAPDDMHVTLCYSKEPMEWPEPVETPLTIASKAKADHRSVELFGTDAEPCLVLRFDSPVLLARARALREAGASSDHAEFCAHVTITYDPGNITPDMVEPYGGRLEFGPEVFAEIDRDWSTKRVEKQFNLRANIAKLDTDEHLVFGVFSVESAFGKSVVDGEKDEIEDGELEKAAYAHVLNARLAGENHVRKGVGQLVESVVFTPEKIEAMVKAFADSGIVAKIDVPAVAWWGGYKITDETVWKKIKSGEYAAFSIGGTATREH